MGSKPKALHTEYASGEANWEKPYGSNTDIVFYLVRADKGISGSQSPNADPFTPNANSNALGSEAFSTNLGFNYTEGQQAVGPVFSAASQTGPGFPTNVQSPLSQVATYSSVKQLSGSVGPARGLAGPLTGLNINGQAAAGSSNQTFAFLNSTFASVANTVQSIPTSNAESRFNGPSTNFFTDVVSQSFVPGSPLAGVIRNAEQIQDSISNGSISDLSTMMSMASGGVTSSKQLIEGINKGTLGFTTQSSGAEANRLGPQGYSRERIAK